MSVPERAGRIVNYLWALAAAVVFVLWLQDPGLFARESIAARIESWGSWMFTGFIGISLVRGFLLVPSTPVILTGGVLFPESLPMVFAISIVGIVVSATAIYLLPGVGEYDDLLERRYPEKIARVKTLLAKPYAFWVVAGWSFCPFVPTDVICYAAGPAEDVVSAHDRRPPPGRGAGSFLGTCFLHSSRLTFSGS